MTKISTTILWLRQDLRLTDNPALEAARHSGRLVPVDIHDPALNGRWPPGAASNWWLHQSLAALDRALRQIGSRLILRAGPTAEVLKALIGKCNATGVCWNRRYEPGLRQADRELKSALRATGIEVDSCNASLRFEPWQVGRDVRADSLAPHKVFTAYWRACLKRALPGMKDARPDKLPGLPQGLASLLLEDLALLPRVRWDAGLQKKCRSSG